MLATLLAIGSTVFAAEAKDPTQTEALFTQALTARTAGNTEEAIRLFEQLLSNEPELNRARAELAVAYFQTMNYAAAKAQIQRVLAAEDTPEGVRTTLKQFQAYIDKESRPHVFTPSVSIGFGHDSNVNSGISADTIQAGGLTLTVNDSAKKKGADYLSANVALAHRYLAQDRVNIAGESLVLVWNSRLSYYKQDYLGSENDAFDVGVATASTGPAIIKPGKWRANLNLQYDSISLGNESLGSYTSLAPAFAYQLSPKTEVVVDGVLQSRDFVSDQADHNSNVRSVGTGVSHKFSTELTANAGVRFFDENAKAERFSNQGHEVFVGAGYRVASNINVVARISAKQARYSGTEPVFNESRRDDETKQTLAVTYKFAEGLGALSNSTLAASYTATQNHSNVATYKTSRDQIGLSLTTSF